MDYLLITLLLTTCVVLAFFFVTGFFDTDEMAQKDLDSYLQKSLSKNEIRRFYDRYIGYLYEKEGYDVVYHGALTGYTDLGRDLLVKTPNETLIVQTRCWGNKQIHESEIFQLYGSLAYNKLTRDTEESPTRAVLYSTAKQTSVAKNAAKVLGIEIHTQAFKKYYPMIKCSITHDGEKLYYLPFDSVYDRVKINPNRNELYVKNISEAVKKGFRRAS